MATATKIKSESDNEAGGGKRDEHSSELLTRAVAAVTTSVSGPWPIGVGIAAFARPNADASTTDEATLA